MSICGSGSISSTTLSRLSSSLSSLIDSIATSMTAKGKTIGSLDSDERDILRFRRAARAGKAVSPIESHGTCIDVSNGEGQSVCGTTYWWVKGFP